MKQENIVSELQEGIREPLEKSDIVLLATSKTTAPTLFTRVEESGAYLNRFCLTIALEEEN